MSRRMIDTALWQNEKFTSMPLGARMLQIGIITHADDQGRAKANPSFLRMQIFPDDEDVTNADIQKWLGLMLKNGTIISYVVDEKQYVQLCNWWKYQSLQYAAPSQFPRPDGWKDRIRKTVTKGFIATCNWQTVDGTQLEDTCDQDGNPLPRQPAPKAPSTPTPSSQSPNGSKPHQVVDRSKDGNHSPESSASHSPESSPEPTIELNRIELNRTETTTTTAPDPAELNKKSGSSSGGLPEMRNRRGDEEFARLCLKFETEGFGTLTQILAEEINALLNEFPVDWISDAMTVAVSANKRQARYVRGILVKWRADGRDDRKPQNGQPPPPKLLSLREWCLKKYHTDRPKFASVSSGIPEATINEQYKQYVTQQQAH